MPRSHRTQTVKDFIRQPYAWPGGYPLFAITNDGACLCKTCAKKNAKQIIRSTRERARDGWCIEDIGVNWEDDSLYCDNCSQLIESAYGE